MGEVRSVKAVRAGEQYEFSGRQNVPIRDLASKMRFVGVWLVVLGVLSCALVLIQGLDGIQGLIWGAINIATGLWTQRAARATRRAPARRTTSRTSPARCTSGKARAT